MVFLQYWCSKPSPLPFYPCHFSFQPCQWFHLASCIQLEYLILGPLTFKHLCRSVMFSFSFLPKLLSPSILPKCIIMLPLSSFSLWSRSFYPHLPTFLYAKQVFLTSFKYSFTTISGNFFREINCLIRKPTKLSRSVLFISMDIWSRSSPEVKQTPAEQWAQNCSDLKLCAKNKSGRDVSLRFGASY